MAELCQIALGIDIVSWHLSQLLLWKQLELCGTRQRLVVSCKAAFAATLKLHSPTCVSAHVLEGVLSTSCSKADDGGSTVYPHVAVRDVPLL